MTEKYELRTIPISVKSLKKREGGTSNFNLDGTASELRYCILIDREGEGRCPIKIVIVVLIISNKNKGN